MSLKERLTSIVKKIRNKVDTQSGKELLHKTVLNSKASEQKGKDITEKTLKSPRYMRTRTVAGRYEIPTSNSENDIK